MATLILGLGVAAFVWWHCQTRLRLRVTSTPAGATVTIGPSSASYTTPADVSMLLAPFEDDEWIEVAATSGPNKTRGRIAAWDGGFKMSFTAVVDKVESMDGAAWVEGLWAHGQQVAIHFPVPGKFAFVYHFYGPDEFTLNGGTVEVDDRSGVVFLAAGAHEIATDSWSARIEAAEGFCVQFFEWAGASADRLQVSFEPDQVRSGKLTVDGVDVPIASLDQRAARPASECRLEIEAVDGSKCDVSITFAQVDSPFLGLRVTHGR